MQFGGNVCATFDTKALSSSTLAAEYFNIFQMLRKYLKNSSQECMDIMRKDFSSLCQTNLNPNSHQPAQTRRSTSDRIDRFDA